MRVSFSVFGIALAIGCADNGVAVRAPVATPTASSAATAPPGPAPAFGNAILEAARAAVATAFGAPLDPRYDCASADRNAVTEGAMTAAELKALGAPSIDMVQTRVTMIASAGQKWFQTDLAFYVFRDARVRFLEAQATTRAPVAEKLATRPLPADIAPMATALAAELVSKECALPYIVESEVAVVYKGRDIRPAPASVAAHAKKTGEAACDGARQTTPPWSVDVPDLIAFITVGDQHVMVSATLEIAQARLCIGGIVARR